MKKLFILGVLIVMAGNALADNLQMEKIELKAGEEKTVAIELVNTDNKFVAFQFDLKLPEGVIITTNNKGKLNAKLVEDRIDDHTLTVEKVASGAYRFLSFSMSNAEFYDTSGPLITITIKAEGETSTTEDATASISNQVFTKKDRTQVQLSDVVIPVEVDTTPTGIQEMEGSQNQVIYNIMGVKVHSTDTPKNDMSKGVYIVNGKKVAIK